MPTKKLKLIPKHTGSIYYWNGGKTTIKQQMGSIQVIVPLNEVSPHILFGFLPDELKTFIYSIYIQQRLERQKKRDLQLDKRFNEILNEFVHNWWGEKESLYRIVGRENYKKQFVSYLENGAPRAWHPTRKEATRCYERMCSRDGVKVTLRKAYGSVKG